jgi:hypothetical protein
MPVVYIAKQIIQELQTLTESQAFVTSYNDETQLRIYYIYSPNHSQLCQNKLSMFILVS